MKIKNFNIEKCSLDGPLIINPFMAEDNRGNFIKDYSYDFFNILGVNKKIEEIFYTTSKKGVVRGIHFQRKYEQAKIVRCIKGKIFDVIVDLRKESPTFGKWISYILSEKNNKELYIPENFGHGYIVLEDSVVSYKCTESFKSEFDDGIKWDDPDLNIKWPTQGLKKVILSEKDKNLQSFKEFSKYGVKK